jgi:hypothetical protein
MINAAGVAILLAACSTSAKREPKSQATESSAETTASAAETTTPTTTSASPERQPTLAAAVEPQVERRTDPIVQVPEEVQRDPMQLRTLMEQVRAQIVYKTKKIPEPEYQQSVRPSLVGQLRAAGFAEKDVDQILAGVDYSRKIEGYR